MVYNRFSNIWGGSWEWERNSSEGADNYDNGGGGGGRGGDNDHGLNFGFRDIGFILQVKTFLCMAMRWLESRIKIMSNVFLLLFYLQVFFTLKSSSWSFLKLVFCDCCISVFFVLLLRYLIKLISLLTINFASFLAGGISAIFSFSNSL